MRFLFFLFLLMPVIEISVLIKVGSIIGLWPTVLLILMTALIGVTLLRAQGLRTILSANQKWQRGEMPLSEVGEGIMLAVAGALLLTPGFVTDVFGFLLLTPGVRQAILKHASRHIVQVSGSAQGYQAPQSSRQDHYRHTETRENGETIIEGEFVEIDERDKPPS